MGPRQETPQILGPVISAEVCNLPIYLSSYVADQTVVYQKSSSAFAREMENC